MKTAAFAFAVTAYLGLLALPGTKAQTPAPVPPPVPELPSPDSLVPKAPGNYLAPLEALRPLQSRYMASPRWRGTYFQELAAQKSFVGNDAEALADFDQQGPPSEDLTDADAKAASAALHVYHPVDARSAILKLAKTHRVLFLNEAHHVPMGRAFALSLLPGLYAQGFRYFAAETLSEKDTQLQKRGYPIQTSGYYTQEPTFGDLVRTALKLGFHVVPYEYHLKASQHFDRSANPFADEDLRERGEAQNVYDRILKHDPHAKILLYAGYGHIFRKTDTITWSAGDLGTKTSGSTVFVPMAVYFQRLSGIAPFSIDQSNLYARSTPAYDSLLYRAIISQHLVKNTPVVFQKQTRYYVSPSVRGGYDLVVCHPPTHYQNGRPDWLRMDGRRHPAALPADLPRPKDASLLLQAFYAGEDPKQAVPIDQIELRPGVPQPALLLPKGRFLVQVVDGTNTVLRRIPLTQP